MTYPPRPSNISIPAVVAGNILQNDDTSISAIDSGFDGAIVMKTQNKLAMLINPEQRVSINTEATNAMLTVNNDVASRSIFRMSYMDSFYFDGQIAADGNTLFTPSCDDLSKNPTLTTAFLKNFDISDHNGSTLGLRLGGQLITATAAQLNYNKIMPGTGQPIKALVLDIDRNIVNINALEASTLKGTLITGEQPNITTLNNINITDQLRIRGEVVDVQPQTLRYLQITTEGIAYPSKAVILDNNRNIQNINELSANVLTGTLTSGPQPNITSLSALTSLTNNGPSQLNAAVTIQSASDQLILKYSDSSFSSVFTNANGDLVLRSSSKEVRTDNIHNFKITGHNGTNAGLILGSTLVTASGTQLNYTRVTPGTASPNAALVLDQDKAIRGIDLVSANALAGTIQTSSQPMITSVSSLNVSSHNGTTVGLSLNGVLVTATASELNYVDTTAGVAQASRALVLNASKDITNINNLEALTLGGTLITENQPNIRQVRTLIISEHNGTTGLKLGTTMVAATADQLNRLVVQEGISEARKALVLDGLKNIIGINSVGASSLTGTLQTAFQPLINRVNTLNVSTHDGTIGLSLNGVLVTATAAQLNRLNIDAGFAGQNKAMVLDNSMSIGGVNRIDAITLGGVLSTTSQLNIRKLQSIDIIDHDGFTLGLSLGGVLITSTARQLNYLSVNQGTAAASKALVLDVDRRITNIKSIAADEITGVLQTAVQPNINRVNTLNILNHNGSTTGLALNGSIITSTAEQLNRVNVVGGIASAGKALVVDDSKNIQGINRLIAVSFTGELLTESQPNLKSVNTLNIISHNASTTGLALNGTVITASAAQINRLDTAAGPVAANKAVIADSLLNISNINSLVATRLTGTIQTPSQPLITSVQTLNIAGHSGGSDGLRLNGILVSATANQLNYTAVVPGSATAVRALVTNEFNSVTGINTLSATKLISQELQLTGAVANFNTGSLLVKTYSFTDMIGRMIDIQLLNNLSFSNFTPGNLPNGYSCEIIGYIRPIYSEVHTFIITCNDRVRLWVNGELLLHSWDKTPNARQSSTIFLNAEQWVPIYIQYQVDTGSVSQFLLEWSSTRTGRSQISNQRMAWDNNSPANSNKHYSQNSFTIYNTSTTSSNAAAFIVNTSGNLTIDASGNNVVFGTGDSVNIPAHDGNTKGLYLGGVLVRPTAYELNYLKVSPGVTSASQALVVDASKSITGLNSVTATSISCNNLTTSDFTISNLGLSGPLNNYNTGGLLIRQITGTNVSGRVVDVDLLYDINFTGYDPKELNTYYSLDIIGYILPSFTESYRFHAFANDRVRIWVDNKLILNMWNEYDGLEYTSEPVSLVANTWVPIYIQFQNNAGSSSLQVRWSSSSQAKGFISSSFMAWDNSMVQVPRALSASDQLTLFSSSPGLTSIQSGTINVDSAGNMSLSARSGNISVASTCDFNISGHNGSRGLRLAGGLVTASAAELNYLSGVSAGTVVANKAMVMDSNLALSGFTSITSTNLVGTIRTAAQPFITSFGTLSSTLNTFSDIVIGSANLLRLASDATACYIQTGSSTTTDSSADLFIGNYGASISASSRKLMIKSSGFVGIQTTSPTRALTINGAGATYCLRLVNNNATGSETAFCDIGVDSSSNLRIGSNVTIGSSGTAAITVTSGGVMKIAPSSGSLQIGNTTNNTLPLEVGSTSFTLNTVVGYMNSSGSAGIVVPTETTYSIRTDSSIIVNGTVCITSDRRLKKNVETLSYDECRSFIVNSHPVRFQYTNDEAETTHCGLIAQDVVKSSFNDLVRVSPCDGLPEEIDYDGYVSPANAAFNVSYDEVIPILMTTMKETISENSLLKAQVYALTMQMKALESRLNDMEQKMN